MIGRRDVLIGGGCVLALGTAEAMRPRRELNLLGAIDLEQAVPREFGGWRSAPGGDFVVPQIPGSLAARLYTRQLMRSYVSDAHRQPVMLLIAYGSSQSDALQLHRPEACYAAVGFDIEEHRLAPIPLASPIDIPGVETRAAAAGRVEEIIYWTRLGEFLPQTAGAQRRDRLSAGLQGYIGDGVLVRGSMMHVADEDGFATLRSFLAGMVLGMRADTRQSLIGTARARDLVGLAT